MTISEFAESRNLKAQTVSIYIRRHFEEFKGHLYNDGKTKVLDSVAMQLLEKQYPMPKPIQIVDDVENLKKLNAAQELIIKLQNELLETKAQLIESKQQTLMLEIKQGELDSKTRELDQAEAELKFLKSRNLFDRIINKGVSES